MYWQITLSPEETLKRFYSEEMAEDQLVDSLILGGKEIAPLLIEKIKDKNMRQRRYAIAALGHLGDLSAVPALEGILKDTSEIDYFQCDALEAIALLDSHAALVLAKEHSASSVSCLAEFSASLIAGKVSNRRTYLRALFGWHQ